MIEIKSTFQIEKIENGFVVRHVEEARAAHVAYSFEVVRQIERFMHEAATDRLADQDAMERQAEQRALDVLEGRMMQQDEA